MIHKIRIKSLGFNLFRRQIPRKLINDRGDNFHMRQFFRTLRLSVAAVQIFSNPNGLYAEVYRSSGSNGYSTN